MVVQSVLTKNYSFVGYWKLVASGNGDLQKTITTGISYEKGTSYSSTLAISVSIGVESGVSFLGAGGKASITASAGYSMTSEFMKNMKSNKEQ